MTEKSEITRMVAEAAVAVLASAATVAVLMLPVLSSLR